MDLSRRHHLLATAAAIGLPWTGSRPALAQTAATGPRTFFGFTLGSSAAALYAEMSKQLRLRDAAVGAQLAPVLTQHSGASGSRAIEAVAKAAPDGRTLLLAPTSTLTLLPQVRRLKSRPLSELLPITPLAEFTLAFCVGKAVPASVRDVAGYLAWVKDNPGRENYGVPAIGSSTHLLGEQMAVTSGVRLRASGYTGTAPLLDDIVAGNLPSGLLVLGNALPLLADGQARILGVASGKRWPGLPQVPTLMEQGVVRFPYSETFGLFAPLGTPAETVAAIAKAVGDTMQAPAMQAPLAAGGFRAQPLAPALYQAELLAEQTGWAEQVELTKFTAE